MHVAQTDHRSCEHAAALRIVPVSDHIDYITYSHHNAGSLSQCSVYVLTHCIARHMCLRQGCSSQFFHHGFSSDFVVARWGAPLSSPQDDGVTIMLSDNCPQKKFARSRGRESTYASNVSREHRVGTVWEGSKSLCSVDSVAASEVLAAGLRLGAEPV